MSTQNWSPLPLNTRSSIDTCVLFSVSTSQEVILQPLQISRNEHERVLIESSVNSIRLSIAIKQADEIERILCKKFTRFMTMRAEGFVILRRKAIPVGFCILLPPMSFVCSLGGGLCSCLEWYSHLGLRYFLFDHQLSLGDDAQAQAR